MNRLKLFQILVFTVFFDFAAYADVYLSSLTSMNSSLSNDHITALCIDSYGFVWIGTASGLNRFDAHNISIFRDDELGLFTDYVRAIFEDSSGDVWVGTDSGLAIYDRDMDRFVPVLCKQDDGQTIIQRVICFGEDSKGKIWISVGDYGLYCYDKEKSELKRAFDKASIKNVERGISSFAFDSSGGILAASYQDNLYYFDKDKISDEKIGWGVVPLSDYFRKDYITSICHINSGNFAVSSQNHGLCIVNVRNGECKTLIPNGNNSFMPSAVIFRDNNLFLGTDDGLYIYSLADGNVTHLQADSDNINSLRSNDINCLAYSADRGLWLGFTGTGGVNFSIPDNNKFEKVSMMSTKESLKGVNVTGFAYDYRRNVLYISTAYKGILGYSFPDRSLTPLVTIPQPVESVCCYDDIILIGTRGGLYVYNLVDRKLIREKKFDYVNVSRLGYIPNRNIVVVGTTLGMYFYDRVSRTFDRIKGLETCSITSFLDDNRGSLWITTMNDGAFRLDIESRQITEHYFFSPDDTNKIPNNKCSCVDMDNDGNIWISTVGSGFCRIDDGKVIRYNSKIYPDLPSDCFYGVINDKNGNYWAKADKGLVKCDFTSNNFYTFNSNSGLLDNNLTSNAKWESINGELFFGSSDGFFSFNPDNFKSADDDYDEFNRPVFTDFYLSASPDRKVMAGESGSPLSKSIDLTEYIELSPWENSFSIAVSAYRLSNASESRVSYHLEGYDSSPCMLGRGGMVSYKNLSPDTYTLYMDGHRPLTIRIRQYWYLTFWVFIVYALILASIIALIARYFYVLSAKKTRRRQEEKLFDEKLTFFSSVVHEIKTPIMLIKSPLKHLLESDAVSVQYKDDVNIIMQNADYLSRLVHELLDYIRNEKNRYSLNIVPVNIDGLMNHLKQEFSLFAADRNLKMDFIGPDGPVVAMADEAALVKILNNLLHNAVKYAKSTIKVEVLAGRHSPKVQIVVSNDGEAIPDDKKEDIFKPFVQYAVDESSVSSRGFGIGLPFARNLASALGGSLVLADNSELISFVLTLKPVPKDASVPVAVQEPEEDANASEEIILVVEDNGGLREYLQKRLSAKYTVVVADSKESALDVLRRRRITLVISDISLSGSSGLELCRRISTSFEYSHIPVILMSSFASDEIKFDAVNSGAVLFLEKPFDMDFLDANVENILNKSIITTEVGHKELSQKLKLVSQNDKVFLSRIDEWLKENLSDVNLDNEAMAVYMNISVPTLHRKMKSLTGLTPNRYIRKYRLDAGAQMLASGKCRVNEVSYSIGFNTPSYFTKCFKEEYGCLPQEYIKKVDL